MDVLGSQTRGMRSPGLGWRGRRAPMGLWGSAPPRLPCSPV